MFRLDNRHILITGASSGLGRAAAIRCAEAGAQLLLVGRNEERLDATLKSLAPGDHHRIVLDLSQTDVIPTSIKSACANWGPLNGLFHAAGEELIRPISITKPEAIDAVFSSSIKAALILAKVFMSRGVKAEGQTSVVMMSSVASVAGQIGLATYSASKGAINAAVRSLACEGAEKLVRFNSIIAGAIQTEMHSRLTANLPADSVNAYEGQHLLGFGTPDDIAYAVQYLLSDASKWVTGTELVVDGGYSCR